MQENTLMPKVALVTGAARRIGAAIARQLHAAGMNLVIHYYQSEEEAVKLCEELNEIRQQSAMTVYAELGHSESAKFVVEQAVKIWQRLDVVINNASRFYRTPIGMVSDFAWDDLINSNLKAPFFLSQAAAPYLSKTQGVIINIIDINAERPLLDYSVYCISKGALATLTRSLAKDLGPAIRVNAVSPGSIIWPEDENQLSYEEKQKMIGRTPLKRSGHPDDIAKAVLFLVQDGGFITGQILSVDGGRML